MSNLWNNKWQMNVQELQHPCIFYISCLVTPDMKSSVRLESWCSGLGRNVKRCPNVKRITICKSVVIHYLLLIYSSVTAIKRITNSYIPKFNMYFWGIKIVIIPNFSEDKKHLRENNLSFVYTFMCCING